MNKEIATIYCDESGNTGFELLSKSDPFFVYAWVLLTKEQDISIQNDISELLKNEHLPEDSELRSVDMWQSTQGLRRWNEVFRILKKNEVVTFITYVEKKFLLFANIFDTYLDSLHNPKAKDVYFDIDFKRFLGNTFYNVLSEDFLKKYIIAHNSGDIEILKKLGGTLARLLLLHPNKRISETAQIIFEGLDSLHLEYENIKSVPDNIHRLSPHIAIFSMPLLYISDQLASYQLKANLVRDHDEQFGEALNHASKIMSEVSTNEWNILSNNEDNSSKRRGLQIADLAAGITSRVLRATYFKHGLKTNQWNIWKSLRGSMQFGKWSYQLTSEECESRLLTLWNENLPDDSFFGEEVKTPDNFPECSCGQKIQSRKFRDFYEHVLECHPDSKLLGFKCQFCNEIIPFWLGAGHDIIDHKIEPPLNGNAYAEMQLDHEVLVKIKKQKIQIVLPS